MPRPLVTAGQSYVAYYWYKSEGCKHAYFRMSQCCILATHHIDTKEKAPSAPTQHKGRCVTRTAMLRLPRYQYTGKAVQTPPRLSLAD